MKAYGKLVVHEVDAKSPEILEFSLAADGVKRVQCPVCQAQISEKEKQCPDCGLIVIWQNSKVWRRRFDITPRKALQACKMFAYATERDILQLLSHTRWESGTLHNLNKLRELEHPPAIDDSLRSIIDSALNKQRETKMPRKAVQNYVLVALINSLEEPGMSRESVMLPDERPVFEI